MARATRVDTWLGHPRRAYSVRPAAVEIAGEQTWPGAVPAEVARLLLARLRKDTVVNEVLQTRLAPRQDPEATRLVDCLLDQRLTAVLEDLRSGQLDPATLDRERDLDFYGW